MTEACPCCGGTGLATPDDRVAALREWCRERGHWISPEDEVRTAVAADILGLSEQWLRTQACYGFDSAIPSRRVGRHRMWSLADLVAHLEV